MTDEMTPATIGGRYETVRPIGKGGMGTVWLARDTVLGRSVAAKRIGAFPGESAGETQRAMREARAAAALNHPNVVAVYDVVEHDDRPWLVMEYVAGPTLATAIRQRGPMAARGAADLGAQLAGALSAAHRAGIVHRDIKPANVLIGGGLPKLGDFGIARSGAEDHLTQTGMVTGTPNYMAPEVAIGRVHGEAADVWALGATIYFAVEGQDAYPTRGNALATLQTIASEPPRRPERAGPLEPVLADMLARDPEHRPTMEQALRRLEGIAAGGTDTGSTAAMPADGGAAVPAAAAGSTERRQGRSRPLLLWLLLGLLAGALVAAAIALSVRGGDGASGTTADEAASSSTSDRAQESPASEETTPEETTSSEASPAEPEFTAEEATAFIEDYFETATEDPDASWEMLAPARQSDRSGYEDFWEGIDSAETRSISANPGAGTVEVELTLEPEDGDEVTRTYTYVLTRIDGALTIDAND